MASITKHTNKHAIAQWLLPLVLLVFSFSACQKEPGQGGHGFPWDDVGHGFLNQTKFYPGDVVVSWVNLQLQMLKVPLPAGTAGQATDRCQAYCGIALYESVVPGMPSYRSLVGQLTDFPAMPAVAPGKKYHWGAAANAALAEMNRRLFPATAAANVTAMAALENSFQAQYAAQTDDATLQRSIAFGKEVATRVFNWAATDGSANVNPPYVPPVGPGLWVPTSPAPAPIINPYAYQRRLLVPGSNKGTALAPPPAFSTDPSSPFYAMVKQVYTASLTLTTEQKAMCDYFKDVPGFTPGGTYVALMAQAMEIADQKLDRAALTYAAVGLAQCDAGIVLFTDKYRFNLIRPVTYIRAYIDPNWSTYVPTPNHPEFPSGHSTSAGAILTVMSAIFGEDFHFTLHTYDYLNYPPRSYTSFTQLAHEISDSRFYGGLHYRPTLDKSLLQGEKVAENILTKIKFEK